MKTAATPLAIGDRLIYDGRVCLVHGFTPMSVEPARIYLTGAAPESVVAVDPELLATTSARAAA